VRKFKALFTSVGLRRFGPTSFTDCGAQAESTVTEIGLMLKE
jgi:hypothetical protein